MRLSVSQIVSRVNESTTELEDRIGRLFELGKNNQTLTFPITSPGAADKVIRPTPYGIVSLSQSPPIGLHDCRYARDFSRRGLGR
jgi:hypothetical protein